MLINDLFNKTSIDPENKSLKISVNVYDILKPGLMTNISYHLLGIGVYHTGIEIGKEEYCFAGHEHENDTGVFVMQPRLTPPNLLFKRSIQMGYSQLSAEEIEKVIMDISTEYTGPSYNLLTRNCNHFSQDLCKRLTGKSIPGWINRAAKLGTLFPCVLPTVWINPPELTTRKEEKRAAIEL